MIDPTQQAAPGQAPAPQGKTVCIASQADGTYTVYLEGAEQNAPAQPAADLDAALDHARTMLGGAVKDDHAAPQGDANAEVEAMFGGFNKARGVPLNRS